MGEHDHSGHDHDHDHGHNHDHGHDHNHDHGHDEEGANVSAWARSAQSQTCPACEASGALMLGGGIFCPACGEITMNPGYQPPPAAGTESEST